MRRALNPSGGKVGAAPLSPGIRAGDFIFVSGQVATNDDGTVYIGDFERAVTGAIDAVERVLQAGGAELSDVVKMGAYLSNSLLLGPFNELYLKRFPETPPARTTLVIAFGHPDVRVELDAVAYVGSSAMA